MIREAHTHAANHPLVLRARAGCGAGPYEWFADELADPRLLGLVRDGSPIYAWPFEERHVWRYPHMPFTARVLEHATRPSTQTSASRA